MINKVKIACHRIKSISTTARIEMNAFLLASRTSIKVSENSSTVTAQRHKNKCGE